MCDFSEFEGKHESTVRNKRAVITAVLFLYLIYIFGLALKYFYKIREPTPEMY